ncbi:hypothetical protein P4S63_05945 [Pseudoalteromonas sp. B193]
MLYSLWLASGAKIDDRFEELSLKIGAHKNWNEQILTIAKAVGLNAKVAQYYQKINSLSLQPITG